MEQGDEEGGDSIMITEGQPVERSESIRYRYIVKYKGDWREKWKGAIQLTDLI